MRSYIMPNERIVLDRTSFYVNEVGNLVLKYKVVIEPSLESSTDPDLRMELLNKTLEGKL